MNKKWFTETEYVDITTGQKITKWLANSKYIIVDSKTWVQETESTIIKHITYLCKKTGQLELFEKEQ